MTVQDFYNEIGGDYEEVIKRLRVPDKIPRFINMFLKDTNYADLRAAMEAGDTEAAFKAAHNLKGVASNLAFAKLGAAASEITESLRNGDMEAAQNTLPAVVESYELLVKLSGELS